LLTGSDFRLTKNVYGNHDFKNHHELLTLLIHCDGQTDRQTDSSNASLIFPSCDDFNAYVMKVFIFIIVKLCRCHVIATLSSATGGPACYRFIDVVVIISDTNGATYLLPLIHVRHPRISITCV